jgi:hypothetical protein
MGLAFTLRASRLFAAITSGGARGFETDMGKRTHPGEGTRGRGRQIVTIISGTKTVCPIPSVTYVKVGNEIALSGVGWFKSTATLSAAD